MVWRVAAKICRAAAVGPTVPDHVTRLVAVGAGEVLQIRVAARAVAQEMWVTQRQTVPCR